MATTLLSGQTLADELVEQVQAYCRTLDEDLPAYSYVPLTTEAQRLHVMKSRYFNEIRAGEVFGSWLRTFQDLEVKLHFMEAVGEEGRHSQLLAERIRQLGGEPRDYQPVPGQLAMFNFFQGLETDVERLAGFSLAGEAVADHLIERMLEAPNMPDWLTAPYRAIHLEEKEHGGFPAQAIGRLATTEESWERARRAVATSLQYRRWYFADLDAAVLRGKTW
jgi:hypothetical protein